jgi:hypothetical protein
MSNIASNQLFLLIKSLSKQEKRYFKIFSQRHSSQNNNYYNLYQIISQQEEYNEKDVILKLKDRQFVNRLSIAKTRLYDQLLKSLNAYHSNKTVDSELFFILMSIEILYQKALYKSAWKKLERGIKLAEKNEKHELSLQFYKWKHKLLEKENYEGFNSKNLDTLWNAENCIIEKVNIHQKLWFVKSKLFKVLFYNGNRTVKSVGIFDHFLKKNLDSINKNNLGIKSEFLLHHIYSAYFYSNNKLDKSYTHLQKNLDLMEKHPLMFVDNLISQISVLTNMAFIGFKLRKHDEISPLLEKLKNLRKTAEKFDINMQIRWFYSYYSIYLAMKSSKLSEQIDETEVENINKGIEKFNGKIPILRKLDLKFALSVIYFKAGKARIALQEIHSVLNELNLKMNPDMFYAARFFYLILLIELNKIDYLNVAWTSTKRSLLSKVNLNPEILVFSDFFDRICKNVQPDLFLILHGLTDDLNKLKSNPLMAYFDFGKWANDKLNSFETSGALAS